MEFIADVIIPAVDSFSEIVPMVGKALGVTFIEETSGRYDEFPAFTASVLGMEIALLGMPKEEEALRPPEGYSIIVQSHADADDDDVEVDISVHIKSLLQSNGIRCEVGHA